MSKRSALVDGPPKGRWRAFKLVIAAALLAAAGIAPAARAQDVGDDQAVLFPGGSSLQPAALPANGIVYDSGQSAYLQQPWDTILLHGVSSDPAIYFEAQRADAAGRWSAWSRISVKRFSNGRFWARAELARAPGQLRIRAVDPAKSSSASVEVFDIEVFSSKAPAPSASLPALVPDFSQGGGTKPVVHSREEWEARQPKEAYEPDVPYRITIHHTDGLQTHTLAESEQELRFIQDFHMNGRGWNDIAYHFLIDADGHIFEGRPVGALGSHTLHNNEGNIGIALMATHHPPKNDPVTPAELAALVSLGRWLVAHYNIDPRTLKGHRDYKETDCPGDLAYRLIPDLRVRFSEPEPAPGGTLVSGGLAAGPAKPKLKIPASAAAPGRWD